MNHLQPLQRMLQTRELLGFGRGILWHKNRAELFMLVYYLDTWLMPDGAE